MVEFIVGFCAGVVLCAGAGFLVWRNNKSKWGLIVDKVLAYVEEYKDVESLKAALQELLGKLK
jgi:hypothetical protein